MYLLMSPTIHSCFDQVVELLMVLVSLRGSVMDDRPRESMQYLVYIKQGTWYLQYLVFGVSSTSLLYIKQAVRSNWYLVSEVLGLNQAM